MFLGTRFQTNNIGDDIRIYLDGCKDAKFLGIIVDENLTWKKQKQTMYVCKLCARNIGILNEVKAFLPE